MKLLITTLILMNSILSDLGAAHAMYSGRELFPGVSGWELKVIDRIYTPDDLWDITDGAAGAYLAYDFVDLNLAEYRQGEIIVHVELYRHSTPENTFGIYASERNPDYSFINIGTEGYCSEGILNFFTGYYYVKIYTVSNNQETGAAIQLIAGELMQTLGQESYWPYELKLFPVTGKVERSEQYISRNFLGFDFLGSAFTADYSDGGGFKLFIIHGKKQEDVEAMFAKYLAFTGQTKDPDPLAPTIIKDPYNGDITGMIVQNYLIGAIGCRDKETGIKYLENISNNLSGK